MNTDDEAPFDTLTVDTNENLRVYAEEYCVANTNIPGNFRPEIEVISPDRLKDYTKISFITEAHSTPKAILLCVTALGDNSIDLWFPKSILKNFNLDTNTVYVWNPFIKTNKVVRDVIDMIRVEEGE